MYLGKTFEQAAHSFGWGELLNLSLHLPETSATFRAQHKDAAAFSSALKHSAMYADIIDGISALCYMVAKSHGGKPRKPKPYERPWTKSPVQVLGSEPIPISEFEDWYYGGD